MSNYIPYKTMYVITFQCPNPSETIFVKRAPGVKPAMTMYAELSGKVF